MSSNQQHPIRESGRGVDRTGSTERGNGRTPRWAASAWARLPVLFVLMLAVGAITNGINDVADGTPLTALIAGVSTGGLALAAYVHMVRYLEGRRTHELAPERARRELGRGVGAGGALFAVTIALVAMTGSYHVHGWGSFGGALTTLGLMSCAAVTEELAFRGALFRVLEEKTGTWGALVVSGLLFGGLHLLNKDATVWGALAIAVEAGLMLGSLYAATRSLWPVIGVHLGWNMAEEGVFGTDVSGSGSHTGGLLHASTSGPQALSGGSFGPEASIFAILVCAVPTVLFLVLAKRRNRLRTRAEVA
ncbi:CPBP family intramembrane metalloprotease [Streptomyces cocklensis]|uniref:CPBP family intramembrane metalloprotease domain-containing protein n=1 Tax=Actinacidiphila cocklensis TaxID=887465 RepID=A0A9W4DVU6_9ACTN|nr:type II CAAX endopeptidase family protein [Actinacidiphila cocklensis]MDD1064187.1 CPBP family intramembrane metalloprotease [Actinacidiphila cocklensis]WSX75553.1 CPBP family intramembrane metalloprotease [Streptomyces sp. NBC_00899]CAG6398595.1 CPBP family intramembrane metalloprotease domain-containing protein [Actinacidiphila cocklensis]